MSNEIGIAIIGAGVSGVYSAWKHAMQDPSRNIAVYEAEERIGGLPRLG